MRSKLTLVLSPLSVTAWRLIVDAGQEVEVLEWNLLWLDTKLVLQLATSSVLDTRNGIWKVITTLSWNTQRVRAASVGPHIWEGNLLGSALLEQELVVLVEEEDGECAVEETLVDVGHKVAWRMSVRLRPHGHKLPTDLLAEVADWLVVLVEDNADLVHEANLLLVVPLHGRAGGVNVREQAQNAVCGDRLSRSSGGRVRGSHCVSVEYTE